MAELVRLRWDENDTLIPLPTCGNMPASYPRTPGPQDIRLSTIEAGWEEQREHLNVHESTSAISPQAGVLYYILHFSLYVKDSIIKEKPGERECSPPPAKMTDSNQAIHPEWKPGPVHSKAAETLPGCPFSRRQGQRYLWDGPGVALVQNPLGLGSVP